MLPWQWENYIKDAILGPDNAMWRYVAFIVLFIGFAIKVPMFPFHTWLPDAHVEAPTPISVILAGVLLKLGTYGMMRINFPLFPEVFHTSMYVIGVFGAINIIYGAFCALAQQDLKKMVAYSSISHMGYVLLGLAAANSEGMTGALYQMFNHGTITAMLFLLVGVIYDRAHARQIDKFGGLATYMPVYTGFVIVAWFASLGLPGLSGFISEALVFVGAFSAPLLVRSLWFRCSVSFSARPTCSGRCSGCSSASASRTLCTISKLMSMDTSIFTSMTGKASSISMPVN